MSTVRAFVLKMEGYRIQCSALRGTQINYYIMKKHGFLFMKN